MILLVLFAFIAGIVTVLSPCILPVLPIVLSGTVTGGKARPYGIVAGFVASFTFFTLFLSTIVQATGLSADGLRTFSIVVLAVFGLSMLIPQTQILLEKLFSRLSNVVPKPTTPTQPQTKTGDFWAGIAVGLSLGLLWTPCVGPILASVISLALTGSVTSEAAIITLAYATGTAIPLFGITYGGRQLLSRIPWLLANTPKIQKGFGVLMIVTAVALQLQLDRKLQTWILTTFPYYGTNLTKFEDIPFIQKQLEKLQSAPPNKTIEQGKPMNLATQYPAAPELIAGGSWINSEPLTLAQLRGKVVLIDFWTYTCINCIRTLPYIQSWHEKYKDKGLVILGVHTPEFEFEKNLANVQKAVADFGLTYPIVQDNEYATWRAYNNRYWPAKYFIDKNGSIRKTHFGEGAYDESEAFIQTLLAETGQTADVPIANPTYTVQSRTPELYLGYQRIEYFSSPERIVPDISETYTTPQSIPNNTFAFGGSWQVGPEYAQPKKGSTLVLNFEAKDVYLVIRPTTSPPGVVQVFLDSAPVTDQTAGKDTKNGTITVGTDRLYNLISLPNAGKHTLEIIFPSGGVELFAFTFG